MATPPPLEPDAIFTADGRRVLPHRRGLLADSGPLPPGWLLLAAAPVVAPVAAAAVASFVGLAAGATVAAAASRGLRALAGQAPVSGAGPAPFTYVRVEVRWPPGR